MDTATTSGEREEDRGMEVWSTQYGVLTSLCSMDCKYEVNWVLGSINTNKASGGDEIPAELFQVLKDDVVKVLHLICQQAWKAHHR